MNNLTPLLREILIKILDFSFALINSIGKKNNSVRHAVFVNWNGKYGDAIASSLIIRHLTSNCGIKVSVITNKPLREIYCSVIGVDAIYIIEKNFGLIDLLKITFKIRNCDVIIPLFGKLGVMDMILILLLNPRLVFSTDSNLRLCDKDFIEKTKDSDIYGIYQSIADIMISGNRIFPQELSFLDTNSPTESYDFLVNPFGSRKDKSLSIEKTKSLIKHLALSHYYNSFGVMHSPDSVQTATQLVDELNLPNVEVVKEIISFKSIMPIIRNSGVLISVDTSLVHVSKVLKKKVVAIFPETTYFNIWQPKSDSNFEIVKSKSVIGFGDIKNMNKFEQEDVDYALNRLINTEKIKDKNVVFLYWHSSKKDMPVGHVLNVKNLEFRLRNSDWTVILTTLDRGAPDYIENYIPIPSYFYKLKEKASDPSVQHGNHSDIVGLRLLEKYGGVYLDTSTIFLRHDFEEVSLYKKLIGSINFSLAGYTNVTFTRKNDKGVYYFEEAKDGMELSILYAKKHSKILQIFNSEIDKYWNWKTSSKDYMDYPLFKEYELGKISFLNEYHIHYTIYHLIITRQPQLLDEIVVQSMHRSGKETALMHGPYAISDIFCRGQTSYGPASAKKMLQCFIEGEVETWDGISTSLKERIDICKELELVKIPGYLRAELEQEFTCLNDYYNKKSLYQDIYTFLATEVMLDNF